MDVLKTVKLTIKVVYRNYKGLDQKKILSVSPRVGKGAGRLSVISQDQ